MKTIDTTEELFLVDVSEEHNAIFDYCKKHMTGWKNITMDNGTGGNGQAFRYFILLALEAGIKDTRYFFDEHQITYSNIYSKEKERSALIEKETGLKYAVYHDSLYKTLGFISRTIESINRNVKGYSNWNFSKRSDSALSKVSKHFLNLDKLTPVGYKPDEEYEDYDGMGHNMSKFHDDFKGYEYSGSRSIPFPERVHWCNVQYDVTCQGSSKIKSIFQAIYAQGMGLSENNNTYILDNALDNLYEKYKDSPISATPIDISELYYEHEVLEAVVKHEKSKNENKKYMSNEELKNTLNDMQEKIKEEQKRHASMTPEEIEKEKEDIRKENKKKMQEMLERKSVDEMDKEFENEEKIISTLIKNKP